MLHLAQKNTILLTILIGCTSLIQAQNCTAFIPADVVLINVEQTITEDGSYWVCLEERADVDVPAPILATFYLEKESELNLQSNADTVYVKAEAIANINGNNNIIYARKNSFVNIVGNSNIVFAESEAVLSIIGVGNEVKDDCATINFDYSRVSSVVCNAALNCTGVIGPEAIIVSDEFTYTSGGDQLWVCPAGDLTVPSQTLQSIIFIENEGYATIANSNNFIYIENGGNALVQGSNNAIYLINGSKVQITGNSNVVVTESGTSVEDQGLNNVIDPISCPNIEIDRERAPSGGCSGTTSFQAAQDQSKIKIFPNPAKNKIHLQVNHSRDIQTIWMYDSMGKKSRLKADLNRQMLTLDVSSYAQGIYYLVIHVDNDVVTKRLSKF